MKILYVSKGDHVDYQDDCLCIGLKELFGADVVDINKRSHLYDTYNEQKASTLYGMGMTVTRVLPDLEVDRGDIGNKIKNKYFDLIVYGSIWRSSADLSRVLEFYPKNKVVVVDGEDETNLHPFCGLEIPYFKRELINKRKNVFPISFSFPTSKVSFEAEKTRDLAICDPRDRSTYIYKNEKDYYQGYRESRFGFTMKKAGWDCMRHYEILGNGCLPVFLGIESCPDLTMHDFCKSLCTSIITDLRSIPPQTIYERHAEAFRSHFLSNNTTLAAAKKFVETANSFS